MCVSKSMCECVISTCVHVSDSFFVNLRFNVVCCAKFAVCIRVCVFMCSCVSELRVCFDVV